MHGGTGLLDSDIKECIKDGICKINFGTELRIVYSDGLKKAINENPGAIDPKVFCKVSRENVRQLAMTKILLCGCDGKG